MTNPYLSPARSAFFLDADAYRNLAFLCDRLADALRLAELPYEGSPECAVISAAIAIEKLRNPKRRPFGSRCRSACVCAPAGPGSEPLHVVEALYAAHDAILAKNRWERICLDHGDPPDEQPYDDVGPGYWDDLAKTYRKGEADPVAITLLADMLRRCAEECVAKSDNKLPPMPAPVARSSHVVLYGPNTPPIIDGQSVDLLSLNSYRVVLALLKSHPDRLSLKALKKLSHDTSADRTLRRLRKQAIWAGVIVTAGTRGAGYGIR